MTWQNRIIKYDIKAANQFTFNPANPRKHPQRQRDAVRASLDTLGWVSIAIESANSGYVLDGHERIWQALDKGEETPVPYLLVDLEAHEESQFLATFDYITMLAEYDRDALDSLLRDVQSDDNRVQALLSDLAEKTGVVFADDGAWDNAFGLLPDSDRAPFQQKTFTLHDSQAETVDAAIKQAHDVFDYADTPNENSNGNALAKICEWFLNNE